MKRIMKKNQVIITVLAVMIAIAGYLTYAGRAQIDPKGSDTKEAIAEYDTYIAGNSAGGSTASTQDSSADGSVEETVSENTGSAAVSDNTADPDALEDVGLMDIESLDYDIEAPGEAVLANGLTVADYLAQAKLTREQSRGKSKEELLAIIDSDTQGELDKQAAIDAVVKLTDCSDRESAAETLLSAKGFENSIVSITDDEVDVIICQENLTDAQLAQIEDIVKRKTSVSAAQICITLMDTAD